MTDDLTLGKGELHFAKFNAGTQIAGGYRPLGNCPELKIAIERQMKDHFSSKRGVRNKDAQFTLGSTRKASITCDNVSKENLAIFFLGEAASLSVSSATGEVSTFSSVTQGQFYQLGETAASPSGARKVASVVVTDGESSPTTYTVGDDYTVDADLGQVFIVEGGAITDGSDIEVTFNITAHTRETVITSDTAVQGSLKFISYNNAGTQRDAYFPWVTFSPSGEISLIADEEFLTISLEAEILPLGDLEAIYVDGRPVTA